MYDPKSMKAEEFIDHGEVEATLAYADANRNNMPLIRAILDKAREGKGLSHREASVLLACEDEDVFAEVCELAREIKRKFYGNRIVIFAPLYLSNYCVNGCVYCPYHHQNHHIPRKKLTQEGNRARSGGLAGYGAPSAWPSNPARTPSTIRWNTSWSASRPSIPFTTRTARFAA